MAQLYGLDLRPFLGGRWQEFLSVLPVDRQASVQRRRSDADRARAVGAGWLLQYALTQAGITPEEQILEKTELGKPYLPAQPNVHFNLSHSGHWAICAISRDPVGVDVELPRCTAEIAHRFFQPEELDGLELIPDQLNRLWTAKEAFVKALGGGLTIPLNSFSVFLQEQGAVLEQTLSPLPYRLHEYQAEESRICLCTTEDRPELILVSP